MKMKVKSGFMKMLGHGVIASSDLFLLDSYQDLLDNDFYFMMTRTTISIPRKQTSYWTINEIITPREQKYVMKRDNIMAERLFEA